MARQIEGDREVSRQEMGWRNGATCLLSHSVSLSFSNKSDLRNSPCLPPTQVTRQHLLWLPASVACLHISITAEFTVHLITVSTLAFFSLRVQLGTQKKKKHTKRGVSWLLQFSNVICADALWLWNRLPEQHLRASQTLSFLCKTGPETSLHSKTFFFELLNYLSPAFTAISHSQFLFLSS